MTDDLSTQRKAFSDKIVSFVRENQNSNKILLAKLPPGFGKTYTASRKLFSSDEILTVWLGPTHEQVQESVIEKPGNDVIHIQGIKRLCIHPKKLRNADKYNIRYEISICGRRCEDREQCQYYQQFEELRNNPQSWVGVHHHLQTNIIQNFFINNGYRIRCLVIDEYFVDNLVSEVEITEKDLKNLNRISWDISNEWQKNPECKHLPFPYIPLIAKALIRLLKKMRKEGISGLNFIDTFMDYFQLYKDGFNLYEMERSLQGIGMEEFKNIYEERLIQKFEDDVPIKNILYEVLSIANDCFKYYQNRPLEDINLPFYSIQKRDKDGESKKYIYWTTVKRELPNVPIIIMDATGDAEFYKLLFDRDIEEYGSDIEIKRNIIQITDGMYWRKSFLKKDTRDRIFNAVSSVVKHHLNDGENHVSIITYKNLIQRLSTFLLDSGIKKGCFKLYNYGGIKGLNVMMGDKILILIGTYEPNFNSFSKQVGIWYLDEIPISNIKKTLRKDDPFYGHEYQYEDERYFAHIRMAREHEIEQAIERLRFINPDEKKKVYLFSMLPIDFKTEKVKLNDLLAEINPYSRLKRNLFELYHSPSYVFLTHLKNGDTQKIVYDKVKNLVPFKNDKKLLKRTKYILLRNNYIILKNGKLNITEDGEKLLYSIERGISKLELSEEYLNLLQDEGNGPY